VEILFINSYIGSLYKVVALVAGAGIPILPGCSNPQRISWRWTRCALFTPASAVFILQWPTVVFHLQFGVGAIARGG
jgi:hypothetical protein